MSGPPSALFLAVVAIRPVLNWCIAHYSGVQIKTRKRNIAVALDPGSFADAVVTIFEDARVDGDNLDQGLQGGVKVR